MKRLATPLATPLRWVWLAPLMAVLAGCAPGGGGPVTRAVTVSDGSVTVTGPSAYCIDQRATRDGADTAFVLFGTCAALSGRPGAAQPVQPGVLTASVMAGAPDQPVDRALPAIRDFLATPAGHEALSRSGRAGTVKVAEARIVDEVLYLRLSDTSQFVQAVEPEYWRAVFLLRGRIVTLAVMGLKDRPIPAQQKRALLQGFVSNIRAANRA